MPTPKNRAEVETTLKSLFGTLTTPVVTWTPVPGKTNVETCEFEFAPIAPATTPTKVIVTATKKGTEETFTYTKDGKRWNPRTWSEFLLIKPILLAIAVFLIGIIGGLAWLNGWIKVGSFSQASQQQAVANQPVQQPAVNPPPTATPPQVIELTPIVNIAAPAVSPALVASRQHLDEELDENNNAIDEATLKLAAAQVAVNGKKSELTTAEEAIRTWTQKRDDAKAQNDDTEESNAETMIKTFSDQRDVFKRQLAGLEGARDRARSALAGVRSHNRSLLGQPLDEAAMTRATETGMKSGLISLTNAVTASGNKVTSVISSGNTAIALAVTQGSDKVAQSVDKNTAALTNCLEQIRAFDKNILAIHGLSEQNAAKMVEILNKKEQKVTAAVNAADPELLKRIAEAMEELVKKMDKPAPAAPAAPAPAVSYAPAVPNCSNGTCQWSAVPCQNGYRLMRGNH